MRQESELKEIEAQRPQKQLDHFAGRFALGAEELAKINREYDQQAEHLRELEIQVRADLAETRLQVGGLRVGMAGSSAGASAATLVKADIHGKLEIQRHVSGGQADQLDLQHAGNALGTEDWRRLWLGGQKVTEILVALALTHPEVSNQPKPPMVLFEDFGDSALIFTLRYWLKMVPGRDERRVASELRYAILEALTEAKVSIPFAERNLHLTTDAPIEIRLQRGRA